MTYRIGAWQSPSAPTFRALLAPLARRCRALARQTLTRHEGRFVGGTVYNFCTPHESLPTGQKITLAMAAGITDHGWTMPELLVEAAIGGQQFTYQPK